MQTEYTFGPFGNSAVSGSASANAFGFTGREEDGTGLLFYRARYYDPSRQRFLSEDPIGFGGGDVNLYSYTFNSPTNFTDPTGEIVPALLVPIIMQCLKGAGMDIGMSLLERILSGRKSPGIDELLKTGVSGCLSDVLNPFDRLGDLLRMAKKVAPHTPSQRALKDLVDEVTSGGRKPLSRENAETVLDWAQDVGYPGARAKAGDVASPSNWTANPVPHIHLPGAGRNGHVPVAPGVQPR